MRELPVVAAAIIDEQGRLLAAQRGPGMRQAGLWELPGGKVEAGETPSDALAREIREELGATIAVHEHLADSRHRYPDLLICLSAYRCTLLTGPIQLTEHSAVRWLTASQLRSLDWAPADVPLLDAVAAVMAP
ncbi:MAG: 8-oxo-dGTP diphosphatase [Myxococcota bacterium]|jgi:8-oxo-dGTP diphosphatase